LTLVSAPSVASENEWSSLDQEIATLTSSLHTQNTGPKVGGWIITSWRFSDDIDVDPSTAASDDESGFFIQQARIEVTGDAGSGYSYKVSFDFADDRGGVDSNGDTFTIGQNSLTCDGSSHSASTPFNRFAWTRRIDVRTSPRSCAS